MGRMHAAAARALESPAARGYCKVCDHTPGVCFIWVCSAVPDGRRLFLDMCISWLVCSAVRHARRSQAETRRSLQVAAAVAGAALIGAVVTEAATALLGVFADARAERRAQAVLAQQLAALVARAVAEQPSRPPLDQLVRPARRLVADAWCRGVGVD